jgi:hypothetical protein
MRLDRARSPPIPRAAAGQYRCGREFGLGERAAMLLSARVIGPADELSSYGMLKVCGSGKKTGKAWTERAREICSDES